ncbi:MAG: hypothetical protein GY786_25380 [Proteobacteria bacterium]|nr:hypothetical protein [Pseudomonadota bacterium]
MCVKLKKIMSICNTHPGPPDRLGDNLCAHCQLNLCNDPNILVRTFKKDTDLVGEDNEVIKFAFAPKKQGATWEYLITVF